MYILNRVPTKAVPKTPFEIWKGWKPSLKHLRIWGCPAEVRVYNPQEKKLDPKTIRAYFVGYPCMTKGYRFYCPSPSVCFIESRNAVFLENDVISGSDQTNNDHMEVTPDLCNEGFVQIYPLPIHEEQRPVVVEDVPNEQSEPTQEVELRRSTRERRPVLPSDYIVYSVETDCDISIENDPLTYTQAMNSENSKLWHDAMTDEMNSMANNGVWDLMELPSGSKAIGCKWVYKTKRDSQGNINQYKARLVAKGFTQVEGVDYRETFSPVSTKDSFCIIMALVAHFNLELHQMDVKTAFLNRVLEEEVYMKQPKGFIAKDKEHLVCKLKKSIYDLKQAS